MNMSCRLHVPVMLILFSQASYYLVPMLQLPAMTPGQEVVAMEENLCQKVLKMAVPGRLHLRISAEKSLDLVVVHLIL